MDGDVTPYTAIFTTASLQDFGWVGVAAGDVLRIHNGFEPGDYIVQELLNANRSIQVDRAFEFSEVGLTFTIFKKSSVQGIQNPLIRIHSIDLLGADGQPTGVTVPYGQSVGSELRSISASQVGFKAKTNKAVLGLVTKGLLPGEKYTLTGYRLELRITVVVTPSVTYPSGFVSFVADVVLGDDTPEQLSARVDAAVASAAPVP